MSAGKYFSKHDYSTEDPSLTPSGSPSRRAGSSLSSPSATSTSAALFSPPPTAVSIDGSPSTPVVLRLNRLAL